MLNQYSGALASFSVVATGHGLTYQWQKDGVVLSDTDKYTGTTTPTIRVTDIVFPVDSGFYSLVITNVAGAVVSNAASLTIGKSTPPVYSDPLLCLHGGVRYTALLCVGNFLVIILN